MLTLLTSLAEKRHGQPAVLRALTRSERAPASIVAYRPRLAALLGRPGPGWRPSDDSSTPIP